MTSPWHAWSLAAIAAGTLVSEDATALGVAALVADGTLPAGTAMLACGVGIAGGDLLLWGAGRAIAGRAHAASRLAARVPAERLLRAAAALDRHVGLAVLASRCLPGTRVALYVTAGASGVPLRRLAGWTLLATALWVPLLVLGVDRLARAAGALPVLAAHGTWAAAGVIALALVAVGRAPGRTAGPGLLARLRHWEFWPMWAFYPPVAAWIAWLAVRHGGLGTLAAANPGLEDGGFVGESKQRIQERLPASWAVPSFRIDADDDAAVRLAAAVAGLRQRGWAYPVVVKPDVGQRGVGVRRVEDETALAACLQAAPAAVVIQPWHSGPYEAGIFYARRPGEAHGRILSITEKVFPVVRGDGRRDLATLVRTHPRFRFQAATFLARLGASAAAVPAAGEMVRLGEVGNHAQGTLFRDGSALRTPALERRVDAIARAIPGFHVGRFDVRYADPRAFMAGEDLAIVELNGVTSEATHLYDPAHSLLTGYRILFAQWRLAFEIGAANRALGVTAPSTGHLLRLAWHHLTDRTAWPASS